MAIDAGLRFANRHQDDLIRAANLIKSTYRSWKSSKPRAKKRSRVYKSPKQNNLVPERSTQRTTENVLGFHVGATSFPTVYPRRLYWDLVKIPKIGSGYSNLNGEFIAIKGIELTIRMVNRLNKVNFGRVPVKIHYGILQPHCHELISDDTEMKKDFFRAYGVVPNEGNSDTFSFVDDAVGTLRTDVVPINTNKFRVICHHKVNLGSQASGCQDMNHILDKKHWCSVNRTYRLNINEDETIATLKQPFYWFMWFQELDFTQPYSTSIEPQELCRFQIATKVVFNDGRTLKKY